MSRKCHQCPSPAAEGKSRCDACAAKNRACTARNKAAKVAAKRRRQPMRPIDVLYLEARKKALGDLWRCDIVDAPHLQQRVSTEYHRRLRDAGIVVPGINEPPPGWSVEEDIREEAIALGEHLALRRVS